MAESYLKIKLKDVKFYAHIGVDEQERVVGNEFKVNISVKYNANQFISESLDTTVSYADLYEIIKEKIEHKTLLLETIAIEITEAISARWQNIEEIYTEITKLHAPIPGIDGECSVEFFYKKNA